MIAQRYRLISTLVWLLAGPILLFPEIAPTLAAVALLVLLLMRLLTSRFAPRTWTRTFLDGFILIYLLLSTVAYLVSPLPAHSLPKLTALLWGAAGYYLAQDWLVTKKDLERLQVLLALAAVALAAASFFIVDWPAAIVGRNIDLLLNRFPHRELVHRNEMAIVLSFLLPFLAGMVRRDAGRWRWPAMVSTLLVLVVIFLTQSRAALLVLVGMGVVYFFWGRFRARVILVAGGAILLVVLAVAFWPGESTALAEWVMPIDRATRAGTQNSWAVRLDLWQAACRVLLEYPVLGTGLYTFYDVARTHYVFNYAGFSQDLVHAHNLFLQSGADMGWPGFLLLLLFWGTVIYFLWWLAGPGIAPGWGRYARLWGVSITGYLLFSMVDVTTLGNRPGFLLWLVLAGGAAVVRLAQESSTLQFPTPQRTLVWIPVGIFLLFAPFWLTRNLAHIRLDRTLLAGGEVGDLAAGQFAGDSRRRGLLAFVQGDDETARNEWAQVPQGGLYLAGRGFSAHRRGRLDDAFRLYTISLALDPNNPQVHYWRALIYETRGELSPAAVDVARAAALVNSAADPDWAARVQFLWGRILGGQGDWLAARPHVEAAIALDPGRAEYYQLLADTLSALGDPTGAAAALEQADRLR